MVPPNMISRSLTATRQVQCTIWTLDEDEIEAGSQYHAALGSPGRVHLVVDSRVVKKSRHYQEAIRALSSAVCDVNILEVNGDIRVKSLRSVERVLEWLDQSSVARRREPVVAIGGGTLLDSVAFAASVFRRGVTLMKVPTTLTGMIDAGVGAKCAIDFHGRKNLIGSYYPPSAVIIDPRYLLSVPQPQFCDGIAEMIKVGVVADRGLLKLLSSDIEGLIQRKFQGRDGQEVISRSTEGLINGIWWDLWESRLDRAMDFGHSISKTIEEVIRPRISHGSAVALDMALMSTVACVRGNISTEEFTELLLLIRRAGLRLYDERIDRCLIDRALADTITHRDGDTDHPLPLPMGSVDFEAVGADELMNAQTYLRKALVNLDA
jgi:3-dehydroquinate synthetase